MSEFNFVFILGSILNIITSIILFKEVKKNRKANLKITDLKIELRNYELQQEHYKQFERAYKPLNKVGRWLK